MQGGSGFVIIPGLPELLHGALRAGSAAPPPSLSSLTASTERIVRDVSGLGRSMPPSVVATASHLAVGGAEALAHLGSRGGGRSNHRRLSGSGSGPGSGSGSGPGSGSGSRIEGEAIRPDLAASGSNGSSVSCLASAALKQYRSAVAVAAAAAAGPPPPGSSGGGSSRRSSRHSGSNVAVGEGALAGGCSGAVAAPRADPEHLDAMVRSLLMMQQQLRAPQVGGWVVGGGREGKSSCTRHPFSSPTTSPSSSTCSSDVGHYIINSCSSSSSAQ